MVLNNSNGGKATMSNTHGTFVWYDLMTSDLEAAESFYRG